MTRRRKATQLAAHATAAALEVAGHVCRLEVERLGKTLPGCVERQAAQGIVGRYTLAEVSLAKIATTHDRKPCDTGDIGRYVAWRQRGSPFPAVVLRRRWQGMEKGRPWRVTDGNHRVRAAKCIGERKILAYVPL